MTLDRTLETRGELSLTEAELLTGRTHQIRASFAGEGHPLRGDGKDGKGEVNRRYGETRQALYSYYIRFDFQTDAGILEYLKEKEFQVQKIPFVEKYFSKTANPPKPPKPAQSKSGRKSPNTRKHFS